MKKLVTLAFVATLTLAVAAAPDVDIEGRASASDLRTPITTLPTWGIFTWAAPSWAKP